MRVLVVVCAVLEQISAFFSQEHAMQYDNTKQRHAIANLCSLGEFSKVKVDISGICPNLMSSKIEACGVKCSRDQLFRKLSDDKNVRLFSFQEEAGETVEIVPEKDSEKTWIKIDLRNVMERYTGYNGSNVWQNMHLVAEKDAVLSHLLSGVHCSITIHLCAFYNEDPNTRPLYMNYALMRDRVQLSHLENLKYTLDCFLSLVPLITNTLYEIGGEENATVRNALDNLKTETPNVRYSYEIYRMNREAEKKAEVISALMSCVECIRCKVWGKVQFEGLKCAVKLLCNQNAKEGEEMFEITKEDVVYLLHLINKLSTSVIQYNRYAAEQQLYYQREQMRNQLRDARADDLDNAFFLGTTGSILAGHRYRRKLQ